MYLLTQGQRSGSGLTSASSALTPDHSGSTGSSAGITNLDLSGFAAFQFQLTNAADPQFYRVLSW